MPGVHEISPPLPLDSLSSMPIPGVGDAVRGATRCGFAAGFLVTGATTGGAGFSTGALGVTVVESACVELVASWTAGRDTFDALFTQLSGSSPQRVVANAAGASNEQAASANSRWSGRVRFTWASEQDAPGTRIDRLYRVEGWK